MQLAGGDVVWIMWIILKKRDGSKFVEITVEPRLYDKKCLRRLVLLIRCLVSKGEGTKTNYYRVHQRCQPSY